jgi:MFS family permease
MRQQQKIHYGWIVVGVTFLTLLLGAGVRSAPGILMVPFEDEFHWSRSTISFAVAVNLLIYGLMGPFAAAMMERFGIRRMMLVAIIGVGGPDDIHAGIPAIDPAVGPVVGRTGTTANVLGATVATRWFTKNRGLWSACSPGGGGRTTCLPADHGGTTAAMGGGP